MRGSLASAALLLSAACTPVANLGSNLLFFAGHETGDFSEWTRDGKGTPDAWPAPSTVEASEDFAHRGRWSAKLTIDAEGSQMNSELRWSEVMPQETYHSAWYYIPQLESAPSFWAIFKLRDLMNAADAGSDTEMYDVDVTNFANGQMGFQIYDHVAADYPPLTNPNLVIPVARWFQIEAFVRTATDTSGEVVFWVDGQELARVEGRPMAPGHWLSFVPCNIADKLSPTPTSIYIDDVAISQSRVGPDGTLP